jgi:hypothetical protein
VSIQPNIVWGAKAIGDVIGRSESATFSALERGQVPGAKKVAGRWLKVFFAAFEAAA